MSGNARLPWLDAAKGCGIIFVVMGHITTDPLLSRFISSFHMPLFFFLSGVAFNFARKEQFIRRHARSLLTPYFVFALLSFLYWFILERHFRPVNLDPASAFLNIFFAQGGKYIFNSVLWFLPCLFVVEAAFYLIHKKIPSKAATAAAALACLGLALVLSGAEPFTRFKLPIRLPWLLDCALAGIFFYALGSLLGKKLPVHAGKRQKHALGLAATAAFAACFGLALRFSAQTAMGNFIFSTPALFIFASCLGTIAVSALAMRFPAVWLQGLGRMSLLVMCMHEPVKRVALKAAEAVSGIPVTELRAWAPTALGMTAVTLLACIPLVWCVRRFFPQVEGRKKKSL